MFLGQLSSTCPPRQRDSSECGCSKSYHLCLRAAAENKTIVVVPYVVLIEASIVDHTTVVHVHSSIFKNVSVSVVLQFGCSHAHQQHRMSHQQGYRYRLFASSSCSSVRDFGTCLACAWRVPRSEFWQKRVKGEIIIRLAEQ
jgi:hypothetical protein